MLMHTPCFICHTVFFARIIPNNLNGYNYSDRIINEIISKATANEKSNILYTKISFYLDLIIFVCFIISFMVFRYLNNYMYRKKLKEDLDLYNDEPEENDE